MFKTRRDTVQGDKVAVAIFDKETGELSIYDAVITSHNVSYGSTRHHSRYAHDPFMSETGPPTHDITFRGVHTDKRIKVDRADADADQDAQREAETAPKLRAYVIDDE